MPIRLIEDACDHDRRGRFCSKCGCEIDPPRLTFRELFSEFTAAWLRRGFRQTALGLLLSPGRQLHRYLRDDRALLVRPISYLVIAAAFDLWVISLSGPPPGTDLATLGLAGNTPENRALVEAIRWLYAHFYQVALVQAGVVALLLRTVFYRRSGFSLAEYTIFMTYVLAQSFLLQGFLSLLLWPFSMQLPNGLRIATGTLYATWAIASFHWKGGVASIFKAALAYFLAVALVLCLLLAALVAWEEEYDLIENTAGRISPVLQQSAP